MGRTTEYSPELGDRICARIAGGESVKKICQDKSMPCKTAVFSWMRRYPEFLEQYERAKAEQADAFAEDILDIADDVSQDWIEDANHPEGRKYNHEAVQRSRLRVDTRKWLASKFKPKRYGDKVLTELTGPDGGAVKHAIEVTFVNPG